MGKERETPFTGIGFSYDGTRYNAPTGPLDQELFESQFLTVRLDNGNYS